MRGIKANKSRLALAGPGKLAGVAPMTPAPNPAPALTHARHTAAWSAGTKVPFDWNWSKNRMWKARGGFSGARYLRPEAKAHRTRLTTRLVVALKELLVDQVVVQNKLWVRIHAHIPDHRGDAVNCLDLVLDAVEDATGLNDRWYEVRDLSWQIVKNSECMLFVTIGQEICSDAQVCGDCGEILELGHFTKGDSLLGRAHVCRACAAAQRKKRKEPRPPPEPEAVDYPGPGHSSLPPWDGRTL